MKNFSDIDKDLLEGLLDSTANKVKDSKKLTKELVERNKVIEKIGQLSWLINDFNYYLRQTQKDTTAAPDCRDLVGNPIKFGDFVMYSQLDDWNMSCIDFGFVISDKKENGRYDVMWCSGTPDLSLDNPFDNCNYGDFPPKNLLVLGRINDIKTTYKHIVKAWK
jgi:hypothetical protein